MWEAPFRHQTKYLLYDNEPTIRIKPDSQGSIRIVPGYSQFHKVLYLYLICLFTFPKCHKIDMYVK